jgi:hypothetical protein
MTKRNITTEILKFAFVAVTIAIVTNFFSRDIKLEKEFLLASLKLYTLAFVATFVLLSGLMFLFSFLLRRKSLSTAELEESVVKAIEKALDQSSLNPHSSNKQHEQHTGKASTKP